MHRIIRLGSAVAIALTLAAPLAMAQPYGPSPRGDYHPYHHHYHHRFFRHHRHYYPH